MRDFVIMFVKAVMDALEEFFSSLTAPSAKFTFRAFVISVGFLILSIAMKFTGMPCFVSWQEALTCVLLMGIIVLIDSSVRSNISSGMKSIKQFSSRFTYTGEEDELNEYEIDEENTVEENIEETEATENGTSE